MHAYHRAALIESAIKHLDEWWLAGTDYTRHWMPSGIPANENHTDLTNHYIAMGVMGGLLLLLLFIWLLLRGVLHSWTRASIESEPRFGGRCLLDLDTRRHSVWPRTYLSLHILFRPDVRFSIPLARLASAPFRPCGRLTRLCPLRSPSKMKQSCLTALKFPLLLSNMRRFHPDSQSLSRRKGWVDRGGTA